MPDDLVFFWKSLSSEATCKFSLQVHPGLLKWLRERPEFAMKLKCEFWYLSCLALVFIKTGSRCFYLSDFEEVWWIRSKDARLPLICLYDASTFPQSFFWLLLRFAPATFVLGCLWFTIPTTLTSLIHRKLTTVYLKIYKLVSAKMNFAFQWPKNYFPSWCTWKQTKMIRVKVGHKSLNNVALSRTWCFELFFFQKLQYIKIEYCVTSSFIHFSHNILWLDNWDQKYFDQK